MLQFFLIVFGFLPLAILGLKAVGGLTGLETGVPNPSYAHTWANIWRGSDNPLGVNWFGLVFGLGFVLSFGYWCTDFLVVQRALAAKDMSAAQRTPLIATVPKMFFPLLVILPGLVAIALDPHLTQLLDGRYDNALPALLGKFYPSGLLGIGLVVLRIELELDLLAVDGDALSVGIVDGKPSAVFIVLAEMRNAACQRTHMTDLDGDRLIGRRLRRFGGFLGLFLLTAAVGRD